MKNTYMSRESSTIFEKRSKFYRFYLKSIYLERIFSEIDIDIYHVANGGKNVKKI